MDDLKSLLAALSDALDAEQEASYEREGIDHTLDVIERKVDDVLWYQRVSDVATLEQITIVGPTPANDTRRLEKEGNLVKFPAYVFTPTDLDPDERHPALVFVHGGVHANFDTMYVNIVRELIGQGYLIIAPEYRGSTGYGADHYQLIDYGGLEVEDTWAAREWLVEHHEHVDPDRVGVIGWSHGGMHALFNAFNHPEGYACAFAGVPVTDLVARMGYKEQAYRDLYEADYHIGEAAWENPDEYRDRSPAWHADELEIPLRIHATRNDGDLNEMEIDRIVEAFRAHEKEFEYEFHDEAPGAHKFERIDTTFAKQSRGRLYDFLATHLEPPGENPYGDQRE